MLLNMFMLQSAICLCYTEFGFIVEAILLVYNVIGWIENGIKI